MAMTRIVSGFAGSLALQVPKIGTRPTSDRVREAMFSALEARDAVRGARVLDLYAGSGALGLEAASRGAASVTLVEKSAAAAAVCRRNAAAVTQALQATRTDSRTTADARPMAGAQATADAEAILDARLTVEVRATTAQAYLTGAAGPFDLVFIDPPYDITDAELLAVLTALVPRLAPDADVAVERSARDPRPTLPAGLTPARTRTYGETAVHYLTAA